MVRYSFIIIVFSFFSVVSLSAQQKKWTLRDCIEYARQENIQVKKSMLSVESYEVDEKQAKSALFPSLSAGVSQNYSHDRNDSRFSGQYSFNASWTVFDGNRNRNAVKEARLNQQIERLNTENQQNDIEISITETYMQILYAQESIRSNENMLKNSEAQLNQARIFLDAGTITRSELAQIESQYSSDMYNLVLAQNTFDNYVLQLKQLLELDINENIEIDFPEIDEAELMQPIPDKTQVYYTALNRMPEIESSEKNIDLAKLNLSSAKGGYLPTVSLSGSVGTSNIYNESISFVKQLDRNFGQNIGVTVSIPIFDNRKNKSAVQKANIGIQLAELNYTDAQKNLLRIIEGLHQDAVSGQSKYQAALDKLNSSALSYELVKEQYVLGMRNTVEMTTEQNNYANAMQELLQAKYTALLSLKLLNFYQGQEITL